MKKRKDVYYIKKGLDLQLKGGASLKTVDYHANAYAICLDDFRLVTPKLLIKEGDSVNIGTPLFHTSDDEKLVWVSPVNGVVKKIFRGEKRRICAVIMEITDSADTISVDPVEENREAIIEALLQYGLWPFLRQRPFGCVADYRQTPKAIFISCFDSAPLAPDYEYLIKGCEQEFQTGVQMLSHLTEGKVYLGMHEPGLDHPWPATTWKQDKVKQVFFEGPHPAGNVGTQINCIDPMKKGDIAWTVEPQYVVMIGRLFLKHQLSFAKTVALTGPAAEEPKYLRLINGASLTGLTESMNAQNRVISGNVLTGRRLETQDDSFLGFYDQQITVIPEGGERRLFGWMMPNLKRWSLSHTFLAWLAPKHKFAFDTTLNGGRRVMMLPEPYGQVVPLDILPMELLKACVTHDFEKMEELGIYDVVEEDFALCDVVCPSKTECQQIIREAIERIMKDN